MKCDICKSTLTTDKTYKERLWHNILIMEYSNDNKIATSPEGIMESSVKVDVGFNICYNCSRKIIGFISELKKSYTNECDTCSKPDSCRFYSPGKIVNDCAYKIYIGGDKKVEEGNTIV